MFRDIRRYKQKMSEEETRDILQKGEYGVLAVLGDDEYPYTVPLNYIYADNSIYFHVAKSGHKLDALKQHNKVSFCVVSQSDVLAKEYTTLFGSVVVFGKINIVTDEVKKKAIIEKIAVRFYPDDTKEHRDKYIEKDYGAVCILEIQIEHVSGKKSIELCKKEQL